MKNIQGVRALARRMSSPLISVVIPVYNEAATLEILVGRVVAQPFSLQVVLVDDGSTDESPAIGRRLAEAHPSVEFVAQPKNRGKGAALHTGFTHARGEIVIRGLSFGYGEKQVLHGVNLEVKPGEVVALVGRTGSGKTTIGRLLTKAYHGYHGSITLDGHELSELRTPDVRKHIGVVLQDVQLFPGDVRFNLSLGRKTPHRVPRRSSTKSPVIASWNMILPSFSIEPSM
jgi:ABC-type multidrug transport system fused ATPase/permease subunit